MKKLLVAMCITLMSTALLAATEFKWTGAADDGGKWTTPGNWDLGEGYPNGDDVTATFDGKTVTVSLDAAVNLQYLKVKGGDVTITNAADGACITMKNTTNASTHGLKVTGNGKLTYGAALNVSAQYRFDPEVEGGSELHFTGTFTDNGSANAKPVYWLGYGKIYFDGDCVVNTPKLYFMFGFLWLGYPYQVDVVIKDNASLSLYQIAAAGNNTCPAANVVQEGNSSVNVKYVNFGTGNAYNPDYPKCEFDHTYTLKSGTLNVTASDGIRIGGAQNGHFVFEGGTATVTKIEILANRVKKAVELKGGTLSVANPGSIVVNSANEFAVEGGRLVFRADTFTPGSYPLITYAGRFTLDATGEKCSVAWNFLGCQIAEGATFVYDNCNVSFLHHMSTFGLNIEVAPGNTLTLPEHSTLTLPAGTHEPMGLKICTNAVFKLAKYTSRVLAPLALEIEDGGKLYGSGDRNAFVAYSLKTNGVEYGKGMHFKKDNTAWFYNAHNDASVIVPRVWTGEGDGTSWADAANWKDGDLTTKYSDISAAEKTIQLPDEEVSAYSIIAIPNNVGHKVTISGENTLVMANPKDWTASLLVGEDCTLSLDVDTRLNSNYAIGFVGGGTLRFEKKCPVRAGGTPIATDGTVVCAGNGVKPVADTDTQNFLALNSYTTENPAKMVIEDGASLDLWRLLLSPGGAVSGGEIRQKGGNVTISAAGYIGRNNYSNVRPKYILEGGTLSVKDGIRLNEEYSASWDRYPGASFEMTGGTLTCGGLYGCHNQNYFRLSGGTLYLTNNATCYDNSGKEIVANDYLYNLGGVTIVPKRSDQSVYFKGSENKVWLTGQNGDTIIAPASVKSGVSFECPVDGPGGIDYKGTATLSFGGTSSGTDCEIGFTGRLTVRGYWCYLNIYSNLNGPSEIVVTTSGARLVCRGTITKSPDSIILASDKNITNDKAANEMTVKRLVIAGENKPSGNYTFGSLTVHVEKPTSWLDGTAGDLSYEEYGSTTKLTADTALDSLKYSSGQGGKTVTLAPTDGETLTFNEGATIEVADGDTLIVDADVVLGGKITKKGFGKIVFNGAVTCPSGVVKGTNGADVYWLTVTEGKADFDGDVTGVRLITSSTVEGIVPRITLKENCHVHDYAIVLTAFNTEMANTWGETYQEGATVDYSTASYEFESNALIPMTQVPNNSSHNTWAYGKYVLNSGSITVASKYAFSYVQGSSCHSSFDFIMNGGTLTCGGGFRFSRDTDSQDLNFTLNGGTVTFGYDVTSYDRHMAHLYLNGGKVIFMKSLYYLMRDNFSVNVGGDVTFESDWYPIYAGDFFGSGTITFTGKGTPRLYGAYLLEDFAVDGATTLDLSEEAAYGMSPEAAVSLANGAKLKLSYDGTMQVRTLTIDGKQTVAEKVYKPGVGTVGASLEGTGWLICSEGLPKPGLVLIIK